MTLIVAGLDLGQTHDHSALVVLAPDGPRPSGPVPQWAVIHAEAIALGTRYGKVARHAGRAARSYLDAGHKGALAVDAAGVGRPVLEMLRAATDPETVVAITAHGGKRLTGQWPDIGVARDSLYETVRRDLDQHAVRVLPGLPAAEALAADLAAFGPGRHAGDTLAALALATWLGDHLARTAVRLDHSR